MGFRTQAQVDRLRLPEGKTDHYEFDEECTGLSVRLQGSAKRWVVWYQVHGRRPKVTIGAVAGLSLKDARIQAGRIVDNARRGIDELAERKAAKAKAADTFGQMLDLYLERRAKPRQRPRTYAETERYLRKRWSPLHGHPVGSITRRDLAARLEQIRVDHGPGAAEKARVYLGMAYSWAMRQGLVDQNPTIGLEPTPANKGDRVLRPAELATVWRSCGEAGEFGTIVRLLMLTGQRREEVAGMMESEIDRDKALWTIPAARTKNKRIHEVPLSRQALALLPERREGRDFLFGRGKKGGFSGFSRAKARLDAAAVLEAPWILHDLRRTTDTHMHEIGVEPHIVEAVLNHVSGHKAGVAGRYNYAMYREQKRAALVRWADWLEAVVQGREPESNVVALKKHLESV